MIVVRQKRLEEIRESLASYGNVLLVGCNTCAAVALAGGEKEVETMRAQLCLGDRRAGDKRQYGIAVLQRQCEPEFLDGLDHEDADVILSLGCGAGVSLLAESVDKPVLPALDTLFIGAARGFASWRAECSACGQCVMGSTAGICPITRCAKGILNGPCGGVDRGKCEVDSEQDCAWVLIHQRLQSLERDDLAEQTLAPRDHSRRISCRAWGLPEGGGPR